MLEAVRNPNDPNILNLKALRQHQAKIVQARHGMSSSKIKYVLQVTIGGISKLYNLSSTNKESRSEIIDNYARLHKMDS